MNMTAVLKKAINQYGGSVNQLAHLAGVPQPSVARFVAGKRDLKLSSADKLAAVLGLELIAKAKQG